MHGTQLGHGDFMKKILVLLGILALMCVQVVSAETYTTHVSEPSENLVILFIVIDFVLILYTMSDYDNKFYSNILCGVISIVLSFSLGKTLIGGSLSLVTMVTNNSTGISFGYDTYNTITHSSGLGLFMIVVGIVMIGVVIMQIIDIYSEYESEIDITN